MPNVQIYLVAAIAFMVAVGASGYEGYRLGGDHVRADYAARDIKAAAEAAALTKATEEKYRAQEQAHSQAVAQIANDYEGKLNAANTAKNTALNAIRSGSLRLRDPGAKACGDPAPGTASASSRGNGDPAGGLSDQLATFLVSEAARADQVVLQLTACQAVIISDRK